VLLLLLLLLLSFTACVHAPTQLRYTAAFAAVAHATRLMLNHLQDDEVDRLERSSRPGCWLGLGRQEVMEGMYGRLDPRPAGERVDNLGLQCFACLD
jgi:hypothetical protein